MVGGDETRSRCDWRGRPHESTGQGASQSIQIGLGWQNVGEWEPMPLSAPRIKEGQGQTSRKKGGGGGLVEGSEHGRILASPPRICDAECSRTQNFYSRRDGLAPRAAAALVVALLFFPSVEFWGCCVKGLSVQSSGIMARWCVSVTIRPGYGFNHPTGLDTVDLRSDPIRSIHMHPCIHAISARPVGPAAPLRPPRRRGPFWCSMKARRCRQ